METTEITGIVLAGGKSSRFGSDKSMSVWKGKTLIENAIDVLSPICSKVIISSNNADLNFTGCEVWPDEMPQQAPMIGIYSCLKHSQTEMNIVLSCDMPLITPALFEYLLKNLSGYEAILPKHELNQIEPLCGVYKRSLIPVLEKFINEKNFSLQQLKGIPSLLCLQIGTELIFFHKDLFLNINTKEDLGKLY